MNAFTGSPAHWFLTQCTIYMLDVRMDSNEEVFQQQMKESLLRALIPISHLVRFKVICWPNPRFV